MSSNTKDGWTPKKRHISRTLNFRVSKNCMSVLLNEIGVNCACPGRDTMRSPFLNLPSKSVAVFCNSLSWYSPKPRTLVSLLTMPRTLPPLANRLKVSWSPVPAMSNTVRAYAKVNFTLDVLGNADGYHLIDSLVCTIDLYDLVRARRRRDGEVRVTMRGMPYPLPPEKNNACHAAKAFVARFATTGADILIDKHIPVRAGLGGPSSDAAATIFGICRYWNIDPSDPRIESVARSIGADGPFFLYGPPAYLDGAGDTVRELFRPLTGTPVALVKPAAGGVSTPEAYRAFDADPQELPPLEPLLEGLRDHDETKIFAHVANNLASASCSLNPEMAEILAWVRTQPDVRAANICGSGATVFAVCNTQMAANAIAKAALERGWWANAAKMEKSGPYVAAG